MVEDVYELKRQADILQQDYERTPSLQALRAALPYWRNVTSHPDFHKTPKDFRLPVLNAAGNALLSWSIATRDRETLEQAVALFTRALNSTGDKSPRRALALNNLGNALRELYRLTGDLDQFDRAITCFQKAVRATPKSSSDLPSHLSNLGMSLSTRSSLTGNSADLTLGQQYLREALQLNSSNPMHRVGFLNNLATVLIEGYTRFNHREDLDEAIESLQVAVDTTPPEHQYRRGFLTNLGAALRDRYLRNGDPDDLRRAIGSWEEAVGLNKLHTLDDADLLQNLAAGLRDFYVRTGNRRDLERSIELWQKALALTPATSPMRAKHLNGLGIGLSARYTTTGSIEDLETSISCHRQALQVTSGISLERVTYLNNLANGLTIRYRHSHNINDLTQAIDSLVGALDLMPPTAGKRPGYLSNLGIAFQTRYTITRDEADLEQAITYCQLAVDLEPLTSPERSTFLSGLGRGLLAKYLASRTLGDLEQAISCFREGLQLSDRTSSAFSILLSNLANCLFVRYSNTQDSDDLEQAIGFSREACTIGIVGNPPAVLTCSRLWAERALERQSWIEACEACDYGFRAVDQLFNAQVLRRGREAWLREAQKLPGYSAYALAKIGDGVGAVVALERGRTRMVADALERARVSLEQLPILGYTDLHSKYRNLAARINQIESIELNQPSIPLHFNLVAELTNARAEMDIIIEAIQQIPGYEDFFGIPTWEFIQSALTAPLSGSSPIGVYITTTFMGSVALIVDFENVRIVEFAFNASDLMALLSRGYLDAQATGAGIQEALNESLPVLGEKLMGPVCAFLESNARKPNRDLITSLILIPTGLISLLPLHCAQYSVRGDERFLLDEYRVQYSPSARVLARARKALSSHLDEAPKFLGIGNPLPLPAGAVSLPNAQLEVEQIAPLFGTRAELLCGPAANRTDVINKLHDSTYIHFSCHGNFDAAKPLMSGLLLANGEYLKLADVLVQTLSSARLAVLSACQTAIADFNQLPEEAVSLPSGFLQAGAAGAIGSLWPVPDLPTALLMMRFYHYHFEDDVEGEEQSPRPPAEALRRAQKWVRELTLEQLEMMVGSRGHGNASHSTLPHQLRIRAEQLIAHTTVTRPFSHPYYWGAFQLFGV